MLKLILFVALFVVANCNNCPTIKPRSSWNAANPKQKTTLGKVPYVIIHHTETPQCQSVSDCQRRIRNIQNYHMNERNWDDIGYNFLIDNSGNIYEGVGWGLVGTHAPRFNSKSVGISFIGDYQNTNPSRQSAEAAKKLIACGVSKGYINSSYKILGHRQTKATACPGDKLYAEIQTWPGWSSSA